MSRTTQLAVMLCATVAMFINLSVLVADEATVDKTRPTTVTDASLPPAMGEWKQWRGPDRANKSPETHLLAEWPAEGPPLAWRVEGLGEAIASVSIADGQIFTMTYANGHEFIVALDQATGNLRWATPVGPGVGESRLMRWLSQRSPTLDGDRLYALTSHGMLVCLSSEDGRERWRKNYVEDFKAQRAWWGFCDYPLVDGDRLICTPGGSEASMIALNKHSGDMLWKSAISLSGQPSGHYAATVVMEVGGIRQYVSFLQGGLIGIAAEDGRLLWRYNKINQRQANDPQNAITPLVKDDLLFCIGARGSMLSLLKLVAENDDPIAVREQYTRPCDINHFQDNPIWVGDRVFVSEGVGGRNRCKLACLDVTSGEPLWQHVESARSRHSGFIATTYADGHLYVRSNAITLVDARGDHYSEKGRFELPDYEPAIGATTPVIAGGHLYLRDGDRLFAYDIRQNALEIPRAEPRTVTLHLPEHPSRATDLDDRRTRSDSLRSVFVPTPRDVVEKMLELADVKQSDRVYDLGSGDGRIVVAAARKYGSQAIGYELDEALVAISRATVRQENIEELVSIEQEDIYNVDLSKANVVAVYLLPEQLEKLIPQFRKLRPGARIVSHAFKIPGIEPEQSKTVRSEEDGASHSIYLYQAPLAK